MVSYETKLLDSGKLLDVSEYNILAKEVIPIPNNILNLEKNILPKALPKLYKQGIYLINKKEMLLDENLVMSSDRTPLPKSLVELDNKFKHNKSLEFYTKCKDGYPIKKILDFKEYNRIKNFISETPNFLLFTEELLKSIEAYYMENLNNESDLIYNDFNSQSSHVVLLNNDYSNIGNMDHFLDYFNLKGLAFDIIKYEYLIFYMDIINKFKNKNPLSVKIKLVSKNNAVLEFYASPSSRRYNINKNLALEELID